MIRFGVKEEYMCFMNELVESEINNMQQFIDRISVSQSSIIHVHVHEHV